MPPPVVEFREVTKQFSTGALVLDRLSMTVAAGDFVTFIGPSGCGKSTLLRLTAGLLGPSAGTIAVQGAGPTAAAPHLSFVFQEPTLLPWLTVAANIELPLRLRGMAGTDRADARRRALEMVKLGEKSNAFPRELSGGQKMRVSLARALVVTPEILLLDEPFGALDEMTREQLNEELLAIRAQAAWTAFFVTHSVSEAVFLSNRVIVLAANPGRVHAEFLIPLPYPRTADTRLSAEFHELVALVTLSLRSVAVPQS